MHYLQKLGQFLRTPSLRRWPLLVLPVWIGLIWLATGSATITAIGAVGFVLAAVVSSLLRRQRCRRATCRVSPLADPDSKRSIQRVGQGAFVAMPAHARADEVASALFTQQYFFPVVQGGEIVGVLSKARLLAALANGKSDRLVAELMSKGCHRSAAGLDTVNVRSMVHTSQ